VTNFGIRSATDNRFSIKSECLDKLVPLGECHLRAAISELVEHDHLERNHQGVDNRLLTAIAAPANENAGPLHRSRGANASAAS
jgi:hypothetical protein